MLLIIILKIDIEIKASPAYATEIKCMAFGFAVGSDTIGVISGSTNTGSNKNGTIVISSTDAEFLGLSNCSGTIFFASSS